MKGRNEEDMMQEQALAVAGEGVAREPQGRQEGAKVIPLFRGPEQSEQPLVTLANGAWKKPDVMRRFAVSARTVERWQQEEGFPHEKPFGPRGPVRYSPSKVEAWWLARCQNSAFTAGAGLMLKLMLAFLAGGS
jgi:predicted DNA-binding transcriptional regulator AlpA